MKFVEQKAIDDCGIAVGAMLSGSSYTRALRADARTNPRENPNGMTPSEFQDLMLALTDEHWGCSMRGYMKRVRDFLMYLDVGSYCLIIRDERERYGHYIAVKIRNRGWEGTIYDPEMDKPLSLSEYREKGAWRIVRVFAKES